MKRVIIFYCIILCSSVYPLGGFGQAPPVIWTKNYSDGIYPSSTSHISKTSDNNFIVAGTVFLNNTVITNEYWHKQFFSKIDTAGNVIWSNVVVPVATNLTSLVSDIKQGGDGRYYYVGTAATNVYYDPLPNTNYSLCIGILNSSGSVAFSKLMGSAGNDGWETGNSIDLAADGSGYTVVGGASVNSGDVTGNHGGQDAWVIKHDFNNNVIWNKSFGGSNYDGCSSISAISTGGYILSGSTGSNNGDISGFHGGNSDAWILKIAENGDIVWSKCLGGTGDDQISKIITTSDGGFAAVGQTSSTNGDITQSYGGGDIWLVKLDMNGNIEWQKSYGGSAFETSVTIMELEDGNFLLCGRSNSTDNDLSGVSNPNPDFTWLVKTDKSTHGIIWQKRYPEFSFGNDLAKDLDGSFYVAHGGITKLRKECLIPITNNNLSAVETTFCGSRDPGIISGTAPSGGYGPYSYQWQQSFDGTNYMDIPAATSQNYGPGTLAQTAYFRRIVASDPCTDISAPITITINPVPLTPTISPESSTTFCDGNSVTLTSSSSGGNQWYKDDVILAGEINPSYVATTAGAYTVAVTNTFNCSDTSIMTTVVVNPNPSQPIVTPTGPTTICSGDNIVLTSSYPANNQWIKDGVDIPGEINQQYNATTSGNYSVRYTENTCSAESAAIIVTVNSLPSTPVIIVNGVSNFCPGGSVTLTSSAANNNQWYLNNALISGANGMNYNATQAGSYTVQYNNGTCNSLSSLPKVVNVMDCNFPTNPYVISSVDSTNNSSVYSFDQFRNRPLTVAGITYFAAIRTSTQGEPGLWKTDGTAPGTILVKSIDYNNTTFVPGRLTNVNGNIFFTIDNYFGAGSTQLWKTDGTETVMVKEFAMSNGQYYLRNLTAVGNVLYFTKQDSLWKSDGTEAGTVLVKAGVINNAQTEESFCFVAYNGALYFNGYDATNGEELWMSDGTAAGTTLVKNIRSGSLNSAPMSLVLSNGSLYFVTFGTSGRELWKSDGTSGGTVLLKAIANFGSTSNYPYLTDANGTLFFSASNGGNDYELWKSDGSTAGTIVVKDINVGSTVSSLPQYITAANGLVYFAATTAADGNELWKSDGTNAGTLLVKNIIAGNASSSPVFITYNNGIVYFSVNGGTTTGQELWASDGTDAGTILVKDIYNGNTGSFPSFFAKLNNGVFFFANNGKQGIEPWTSDATANGTWLLKDINTFSVNSLSAGPLNNFTNVNGLLYFVGQNMSTLTPSFFEKQVWKSNGADTGTRKVTSIYTFNGTTQSSEFNSLTAFGNDLVFAAADVANGNPGHLYKTDGINTTDLNLFTSYNSLTRSGSNLYFIGGDNALYVTDATAGNQTKLCNVVANNVKMCDVNGTLYFIGNTSAAGYELWKTDGTVAGTVLVKDVLPGNSSSNIMEMVDVNGTLFFNTPTQLWKSDGSSTGTVMITGFASTPTLLYNFNGLLVFVQASAGFGNELWKSDGTVPGTMMVKDIWPGGNDGLNNVSSTEYPMFTAINGILYFTANDGLHGRELWKTNGTPEGTVLVKDIMPGAQSSDLNYLTAVAGVLCFRADDGVHGYELWASTGEEICTNIVTDMYPGTQNAMPQNLTEVNQVLYYSAFYPYTGKVLCKYNPWLPTTQNATYSFSGDGNWNDVSNWCNNNMPPLVLPKGSEIVIKTIPNVTECVLNGTQTISSGAKLTITPGSELKVAGNLIVH